MFTLRPSTFSGGKIFSITWSIFLVLHILQIRVTFCNFSLEIWVLLYSWVRFSRYSVSADESCETVKWFQSRFDGFPSWGEVAPWDTAVWLDWEDSIFRGAWWVIIPHKNPTIWRFWKIWKTLLKLELGSTRLLLPVPSAQLLAFFEPPFSSSSSKIRSKSSGVWTATSVIIKRNILSVI